MTQNLPTRNIAPNPQEMQILQTIARTASTSGLYSGVGNEQKILMILLAARELGIKPMMAFATVVLPHPLSPTKPNVSPDLIVKEILSTAFTEPIWRFRTPPISG